ncbi:hypothetical protein EBU71_12755, partial [bacterium]|nr:hypothetical protein [Candidatus Elulimicrobium humile]
DQSSLKEKIFLGKKSVGGQNIMSTALLSTDVDIFFYNTKTEPQANYHTTVAFLAGTGSNTLSGNIFAPYVKSTVVANPGYSNTIDFEIINPNYYDAGGGTYGGGNINMRSQYGNIALNGIYWPTYAENTVAGNNDYVLKYKWIGGQAYARWEQVATAGTTDTLFSAGTVSITGSPVILNGLPINFTSLIPTPTQVGGVLAGSTFSNIPTTEMIRRILYPYIQPTLDLTMEYPLLEIGDNTTGSLQRLNFLITKNSTYSITSFSVTPASR